MFYIYVHNPFMFMLYKVWGVGRVSFYLFTYLLLTDVQFLQHHLLKDYLFPH